MMISVLRSGAWVPGGPEDEEVPVGGRNGKWPEIWGNPVSLVTDEKVEAKKGKDFSEIAQGKMELGWTSGP